MLLLRLRTAAVLVLLAAVALGAAGVSAWRSRGAESQAAERTLVFTARDLPVNDITRITLERRDEPARVFERDGATWRQVEPFSHPMDAYSMGQLIRLAASLETVDRIDPATLGDDATLASLDLDPPRATVRYEWPDGGRTLTLGRLGVAGRAFMRVDDAADILVVGQALHDRAIEMSDREWRDRRFFRDVGPDVERIVIEAAGDRVVLERDARTWRLLEPVRTRLDPDARDAMLQALGTAQNGGFILDQPDDLARFGLAEPPASVTVTTTRLTPDEAGELTPQVETQRVLIGAPIRAGAAARYAMVEGRPTVVQAPEGVLRAWLRPVAQLADPTGSGVSAADVARIAIRPDEGEGVELARDLDHWTATSHGGAPVDAAAVNELLEQLTALRAPRVIVQDYPADMQVAIVTLYGFSGRPIDTVRIIRAPQTEEWAFENGDRVLRVLPASLRLRLNAADFGLAPVDPGR